MDETSNLDERHSNNQNQSSFHYNDDNDYDSDIESKLYAEIYHSNTIVGDINNVHDELLNEKNSINDRCDKSIDTNLSLNMSGDKEDGQSSLVFDFKPTKENDHVPSVKIFSSETTNVSTPKNFNVEANQNRKRSSSVFDSSQDEKTSSGSPVKKSKKSKRNSEIVYDKTNRKNDHSHSVNVNYSSKDKVSKNSLTIESPKSTQKKRRVESTELTHGKKKSSKQKYTDVTIQNKKSKNNIVNTTENCLIIDISSDSSSQDASDSQSKFNQVIETNKKLKNCSKRNSDDNVSDSDESIFEVPIPPKPLPPLIDLKDSDNESSNNESNPININVVNCADEFLAVQEDRESQFSNEQDTIQQLQNTNDEENLTTVQDGGENDESIQRNNAANVNVNNTKQIYAKKKEFFKTMKEKMKDFYNKSWGGENFDMQELKKKMSSDPSNWAILRADTSKTPNKRRYFGMICSICNRDGHRNYECTEKSKGPICHMCGINGHIETSCPNRICLTCGVKQQKYKKTCHACAKMLCKRCHSRGHLENSCPDLWRRYHHTINNNEAEEPKNFSNVMKSKSELFCCNCAEKGHDAYICTKYRWSQHFSVPSFIVNYDGPAYNSKNLKKSPIVPNEIIEEESTITDNNNIIFMVKSKSFYNDHGRNDLQFSLNILDENDAIDDKNWQILIKFLKDLASDFKLFVLLEKKNDKLHFTLSTEVQKRNRIKNLILQYADRRNPERSRMFLKCDRSKGFQYFMRLNQKINEMNSISENLSDLYEKYQQLNWSRENENEIVLLQEKLLMILHKDNFVDKSIKKLLMFRGKLQRLFVIETNGIFVPKKTYRVMTFKLLFDFMYLFNKVFTSNELKNLSYYVKKYLRQNTINEEKIDDNVNHLEESVQVNLNDDSSVNNNSLSVNQEISSQMTTLDDTSKKEKFLFNFNGGNNFIQNNKDVDQITSNNLNNHEEPVQVLSNDVTSCTISNTEQNVLPLFREDIITKSFGNDEKSIESNHDATQKHNFNADIEQKSTNTEEIIDITDEHPSNSDGNNKKETKRFKRSLMKPKDKINLANRKLKRHLTLLKNSKSLLTDPIIEKIESKVLNEEAVDVNEKRALRKLFKKILQELKK